MKALRYTNAVLTVLAVLLSIQLWTTWHGRGLAAIEAAPTQAAPPDPSIRTGAPGGLPDAGAQRRDIIDLLKRQVQQSDELTKLLRSGQVRVRVENPPKEGAAAVKDADRAPAVTATN
jgi:hypothetical protein